jgi:hypothetical protein
MSFSKTVSVCAALASIFAAGAAGWKLANEKETTPTPEINQTYEQNINELQQKISELEQKEPIPVATPTPQAVQPAVTPPPLPPVPPVNEPPQE